VQVREQGVAQNGLERERGEHPVEEQLRARLVVGVQGSAEVPGEPVDRAAGRGGLVLLREPGGLGRGEPAGQMAPHRLDPLDVRERVEPEPSTRPLWVE
jgi:hypothetical protein